MNQKPETGNGKPETGWDIRFKLKLTLLGLAVLLLLVFVFRNFQKVTVDFLVLDLGIPLSLLILGSLLAGAALAVGVMTLRGFLRR